MEYWRNNIHSALWTAPILGQNRGWHIQRGSRALEILLIDRVNTFFFLMKCFLVFFPFSLHAVRILILMLYLSVFTPINVNFLLFLQKRENDHLRVLEVYLVPNVSFISF